MREFMGYMRPDGSVGTRNYVAVLPSVNCMNDISYQIAAAVPGTVPLCHTHMCPYEIRDHLKGVDTVSGLGKNPNVHSVLVVGMGCEKVKAAELADMIAVTGKPVMALEVQTMGYDEVMEKGIEFLKKCMEEAAKEKRVPCPVSGLTFGIKCGGSGAMSLISNNAAVGKASDMLIEEGGSVIFSETPEILGMQDSLAARAVNEKVAKDVLDLVDRLKAQIEFNGVDLIGSEPNAGNMKSGLTTIEEKSLGAVAKGGTKPLSGVLEFGAPLPGKGLYFMDCESAGDPVFAGETAAGAQLGIMTIAGGGPGTCGSGFRGMVSNSGSGIRIMPAIKVIGGRKNDMDEPYVDVSVTGIVEGRESIDEAGERVFEKLLSVASGELTYTEKHNKYWATIPVFRNGLVV